jgi:hypothetical protein
VAHRRVHYDMVAPLHPDLRLAPLVYPCLVRRTPRISCEAVPPSVSPAGAQGGTLSCRSGAALSFVSCIRLFGRLSTPSANPPWSSA